MAKDRDVKEQEPTPTTAMGRSYARERVVSALIRHGAASRAELARHTSLAPSTVTAVIADLADGGLIVERGSRDLAKADKKGGRPATLLSLHRSAGVVVGIDLGKRHLRVAVADLSHTVLAERSAALVHDRTAAQDIAAIATMVEHALAEARSDRSHVIGIGMGLPGPVVAETGRMADSTILPGWVGVDAAAAVGEAVRGKVEVDNDANLGALAEWTWGSARGCSDFAYVKVSTGIGAGLILDDRPYRGPNGTAGEIGHTVIESGGPICRCGNRGCLEVLAGTQALLDALRPVHGDALTTGKLVELAVSGDLPCRRAITDAGRVIGIALANVCNLVNPTRIVVGGELAGAGELLLEPLRDSLTRFAITPATKDLELVQGSLGHRAEVLGALAIAVRGLTQPDLISLP